MTGHEEWEPEAAELVRPYVITKGRGLPDEQQLSLITLVTAAPEEGQRPTRLSPRSSGCSTSAPPATCRSPRSPATPGSRSAW